MKILLITLFIAGLGAFTTVQAESQYALQGANTCQITGASQWGTTLWNGFFFVTTRSGEGSCNGRPAYITETLYSFIDGGQDPNAWLLESVSAEYF